MKARRDSGAKSPSPAPLDMALPAQEKFQLLLYSVLFLLTFTIIYLAVNRSRGQPLLNRHLNELDPPSHHEAQSSPTTFKKTDGQRLSRKIAKQQAEQDQMGEEYYQSFLNPTSENPLNSPNLNVPPNAKKIIVVQPPEDPNCDDNTNPSLDEEISDSDSVVS